jgi:hypothetical protein
MNQNPDKNCSAPYNDAVRKALRVRRNDLQRTIEIKSTSKDYVTRQRERQATAISVGCFPSWWRTHYAVSAT